MKITDLQNYTVLGGTETGASESVAPSVKTSTSKSNTKQSTPGFVRGLGRSALQLLRGGGELGEKIGNVAIGRGFKTMPDSPYNPESKVGKKLKDAEVPQQGEGFGKFVGDVAQFAIPGSKITTATKGSKFVPKVLSRAGTSAGVASIQEGEVGKEAGIAGAVEAAIPVAGKIIRPATRFIGNLLKGTGSALSGAPSEAIEQIYKNPKVALQTAKEIRESGGSKMLRQNAENVLQGVGNIRREARSAYGKGLEQLSEVDITPKVFKDNMSKVLEEAGSVVEKGVRKLGNVEFDDPRNIQRANDLINKLQVVKLDGTSLRKLADDIENSRYKTATSDERLAFNAFVKKLSDGLKSSINSSTSKLDEINQKFSQDVGIAEAVEKILGKSKYRTLSEILNTSKKLEALFTQKGLGEDVVDDFLERAGISKEGFKTSEAMRQVGTKGYSPNQIGANPLEIVRAFTSSAVSPKMVGTIAAYLGVADSVIKEMSEKLSPTARGALIELLLGRPTEEPEGQ